ncbi:MAG TPA: GAF domain-containing protein, partial [Longimicrobium sp.]|nr:GAF domain-containing protein [Longimicrobium sp.]
ALRFLADASRTLSASLDYHATLQSLVRLAVPRLADGCTVDLREEDGSVSRLSAHGNPALDEIGAEMRRRYPLRMDVPGGPAYVIRTGKPSIVRDFSDANIRRMLHDDEEHVRLFKSLGYREVMTVPLEARGRVLGALSLVLIEKGRSFDDADLSLASELASRAALAMDNARLYREAQLALARKEEEARHNELLRRVGNSLVSELDPQRLVDLITGEAATACGGTFAAFFSTPLGDAALPLHASGAPREVFAGFPRDLLEPSARGTPLRVDDVGSAVRPAGIFGTPPMKSLLVVPVPSREGTVAGVIAVGHPSAGVFTPSHERLVTALAAQASIALENSRLFRRLTEAEAKSRSAEERLLLTLSAGRMGYFDLSATTGEGFISPEAHALLGYAQGEIRKTEDFLARVHPEDRADMANRMAELMRSDRHSAVTEYRLQLPDGTVRHIEAHVHILRDEEGRPLRQLGVMVDVTGRVEAAEQARRLASEQAARAEAESARKRVAAILDSIGEPLFALDRDQRLRFANRRAEESTGIKREELIGRPALELFPGPQNAVVLEKCEQALRENTMVELEHQFASGQWLELRACPFDEGVSIYLRDITARKRELEAEAR